MKNSKVLTRSQLQKVLNRLAAANAKAHKLRAIINEHCEAVYGYDPADVDFDEFIDCCDAGCGAANGMSVDRFEAGMLEGVEVMNALNSELGICRNPKKEVK